MASAALGIAAIAIAAQAFAQGQAAESVTPDARSDIPTPSGGIPVGPLTVYPGVDLALGYDDNLFQRQINPKASTLTILSPSIRAEARSGPHRFDIGMRINDGRYHQSPADSYYDYGFVGNADMVFSGRAGLKLRAEFRHARDPRGSNDRRASEAPDEYDNAGIAGTFSYGAPGAQGRIEVDASAFDRQYTNNHSTTEESDRITGLLGGTFFWRMMPRTELLTQLAFSNIDYKLSTSTQDSSEARFLVGAKWEATAATSGTAKFGRLRKEFDSPARQSTSDSTWDAGVRWSPLSYSTFEFNTNRQFTESTGLGDAILGTNYGVTWNHAWSSRLSTQALASLRTDDYKGAGVTRKDETASFGLRASYEFRRWLRLNAEATHAERESNEFGQNYKRNLLMFTVGGTL